MCRVPVHCFRVVRTSSNLLEPLQCRERKVCEVFDCDLIRSGSTGYRTFSNLIFDVTVEPSRNKVCRVPVHCFRVVQPPRTFSNHFSAEKARCVDVFDVVPNLLEPHLHSGNKVCRVPRTSSNLLEPHLHSGNKVCRVHVHCFRVVQPPRTSSNLLEPLQCRESKVCRSL